MAVLFSNSLGTAFGDFLNDNLGLSYLPVSYTHLDVYKRQVLDILIKYIVISGWKNKALLITAFTITKKYLKQNTLNKNTTSDVILRHLIFLEYLKT